MMAKMKKHDYPHEKTKNKIFKQKKSIINE